MHVCTYVCMHYSEGNSIYNFYYRHTCQIKNFCSDMSDHARKICIIVCWVGSLTSWALLIASIALASRRNT